MPPKKPEEDDDEEEEEEDEEEEDEEEEDEEEEDEEEEEAPPPAAAKPQQNDDEFDHFSTPASQSVAAAAAAGDPAAMRAMSEGGMRRANSALCGHKKVTVRRFQFFFPIPHLRCFQCLGLHRPFGETRSMLVLWKQLKEIKFGHRSSKPMKMLPWQPAWKGRTRMLLWPGGSSRKLLMRLFLVRQGPSHLRSHICCSPSVQKQSLEKALLTKKPLHYMRCGSLHLSLEPSTIVEEWHWGCSWLVYETRSVRPMPLQSFAFGREVPPSRDSNLSLLTSAGACPPFGH